MTRFLSRNCGSRAETEPELSALSEMVAPPPVVAFVEVTFAILDDVKLNVSIELLPVVSGK